MINGPTISDAIIHPEGVIAVAVRSGASAEQLIDTVYLSTLCRHPSNEELQRAVEFFADVPSLTEAGEDLMWALINSPAFLFNR